MIRRVLAVAALALAIPAPANASTITHQLRALRLEVAALQHQVRALAADEDATAAAVTWLGNCLQAQPVQNVPVNGFQDPTTLLPTFYTFAPAFQPGYADASVFPLDYIAVVDPACVPRYGAMVRGGVAVNPGKPTRISQWWPR